ncbi:MAG: hypothetical protein MUE72_08135 [Chitinophagaceae bacterium]|nr:hypothetical protein [Chitinophagaceae bacterium]
MKKMIIAALIAVTLTTSSFAADANKVSTVVMNAFITTYGDIENVKWSIGSSFIKAAFTIDGQKQEAFYSFDGKEIATSKPFAFDKLPKNALRKIATKYPFPPYKLKECIEFTDVDEEKNYFISLELENKEKLILKVTPLGSISIFQSTKSR